MGDGDLVNRIVSLEQIVAGLEAMTLDLAVEVVSLKIACDLGERQAINPDVTES